MVTTSQKRVCVVYVPFPQKEVATKIAEIMIREQLAACANILGPSMSLYAWKGKMVKEKEFVAIFKTTERKYKNLEKRIMKLHPYDCPCIAKIAVSSLNSSYLDWLVQTVSSPVE